MISLFITIFAICFFLSIITTGFQVIIDLLCQLDFGSFLCAAIAVICLMAVL